MTVIYFYGSPGERWSLDESVCKYGGKDDHIHPFSDNLPLVIGWTNGTVSIYHRYERVEEIVWVKTNQLQRIIRTGRTGHWLNHSKEHCLVGVKGNPQANRFIDCDVIVAEVCQRDRIHCGIFKFAYCSE